MQCLEDSDELVAKPVLESHPAGVNPAGDEEHLLVFDIDALERPDPSREREGFRLAEGFGRVPTAVTLPYDRRVEAFFDRCPDRERRGERVALDDQVGAVTDTDLIDGGKEVVGRVAGEYVREAGLDADAAQGQLPPLLPLVGQRELFVPELDTRLVVRVARVWTRQGHGHIQVGRPCGQRGTEDRHHKTGIDCIEHGVAGLGPDQLLDGLGVARVKAVTDETVPPGRGGMFGPLTVVIGDHDPFEQPPASRRPRHGHTYAASTDHKHPHDDLRPSGPAAGRADSADRVSRLPIAGAGGISQGPKVPSSSPKGDFRHWARRPCQLKIEAGAGTSNARGERVTDRCSTKLPPLRPDPP